MRSHECVNSSLRPHLSKLHLPAILLLFNSARFIQTCRVLLLRLSVLAGHHCFQWCSCHNSGSLTSSKPLFMYLRYCCDSVSPPSLSTPSIESCSEPPFSPNPQPLSWYSLILMCLHSCISGDPHHSLTQLSLKFPLLLQSRP